ncbi:MAG: hypothetical protein EOO16_19610 [Chitinophagaceae bacterium]|nr:MAG: hypothetical protein EOO16_19610 [Chitinophagaceae bacterium]
MILPSALPLLALLACTRHQGDVPAPATAAEAAMLTIFEPGIQAQYRFGDTLHLRAIATAPATIHGYEWSVCPVNDTTRLYSEHVHDHNDTLHIDRYWVNDRPTPVALELRITLTLDHEGHTLLRTVPFEAR